MSPLGRLVSASIVCLLFAGPAPAAAQDVETLPVPLLEVSSGYVFMRDFSNFGPGVDNINFPAGWYFSSAVNPTEWFGVVGELSGSYRNSLDLTIDEFRTTTKLRAYSFMGGARFFRKVGRVVPFGQALAGLAHMRVKTTLLEPVADNATFSDSENFFAVQPGAGVTVYLTEHAGVRGGLDYRMIVDTTEADETQYRHEFRVAAGFTLQWGGR